MSSDALLRNTLLEKLAAGQVVASMIVRSGMPHIARLAHTAGFDTLYVDLEHSTISLAETGNICLEAIAAGLTPLVRVPSLATVQAVLDAGALGIIVPHVRTAADAVAAVDAVKYPPEGNRGSTSMLPQLMFRNVPQAVAHRVVNAATMVAVMIEDAEALENVEAIAAVPGIDLLHVGTNDLTASMGMVGRHDDPRVIAAYARIIAAARTHAKYVGTGGLAGFPEIVAELVRMGVRYVSTGVDIAFLLRGMQEQVARVRALSV